MNNLKQTVSWCGRATFANHDPFIIGTVHLPIEAQFHEVERALLDLWHASFPFNPPKIEPVRGMVYFIEDDSI